MARTRTSKVNKGKKVVAVSNRIVKRSQRPRLTYKEAGVTTTVNTSSTGGRRESDRLITGTRTYFNKEGGKLHSSFERRLEFKANLCLVLSCRQGHKACYKHHHDGRDALRHPRRL